MNWSVDIIIIRSKGMIYQFYIAEGSWFLTTYSFLSWPKDYPAEICKSTSISLPFKEEKDNRMLRYGKH